MQERIAKEPMQSRTIYANPRSEKQASFIEILDREVMQRKLYKNPTNAKSLIDEQSNLQSKGGVKEIKEELKKDGGSGEFTTMGFEHEFAQMPKDKNILNDVTHVELAKSTAPEFSLTNLKFSIETDASNAIELVSPPFILETLSKGVPIPDYNDVDMADRMMKNALTFVAQNGINILGMINIIKDLFGISFDIVNINAKIKTANVNCNISNDLKEKKKTNPNNDPIISGMDIYGVEIGESRKTTNKEVGIGTQANFETTAEIYDLSKRVLPRLNHSLTNIFKNIELGILTEFRNYIKADSPVSDKGFLFLRELAKNLSQLLAVHSITMLSQWKNDILNGKNIDQKLFKYHRNFSSVAKDTDGVWLKDSLISFARVISDEEINTIIAVCNRPNNIMSIIKSQAKEPEIQKNVEWVENTLGNYLSRVFEQLEMPRNEKSHPYHVPEFGEYNPELPGIRQDTFISPEHIIDILENGEALHVTEIRRGDMKKNLKRITIAYLIKEGLNNEDIKIIIKDMSKKAVPEDKTIDEAETEEMLSDIHRLMASDG